MFYPHDRNAYGSAVFGNHSYVIADGALGGEVLWDPSEGQYLVVGRMQIDVKAGDGQVTIYIDDDAVAANVLFRGYVKPSVEGTGRICFEPKHPWKSPVVGDAGNLLGKLKIKTSVAMDIVIHREGAIAS